jgi:hypothetical protein
MNVRILCLRSALRVELGVGAQSSAVLVGSRQTEGSWHRQLSPTMGEYARGRGWTYTFHVRVRKTFESPLQIRRCTNNDRQEVTVNSAFKT